MNKRVDKARDKEEGRIEMHKNIDKVRDQEEGRIEMHKNINRIRDQTEDRIKMHRRLAEERRRAEERKVYENNSYTKRYLKSIDIDTGFNVICICCAEFKSRYACTGIQVLSDSQQKKYLIRNDKRLVSKDGKLYICKPCRSQIDANKLPKKSEKKNLKFSEIPSFLRRNLKKVTDYVKVLEKRKLSTTNEENINQVLELNKLEAHLLKLVIPFVRIAHCQRGSYLKVKGNLILISANITHSLSKILPKEQNILPVCFKRKMEYKGNFLEEMIDKNKVDLYFKFFKNYNPLYKDILMEEERIDKFQTECQQVVERFEDAEVETVKLEPDDGDSHSDTDTETSYDNCENFEGFNIPEEEEETYFFRDQSTVFCNKYEEDISVPSVANRLANIIVDVEIANNIDSESYEPENMDVNE